MTSPQSYRVASGEKTVSQTGPTRYVLKFISGKYQGGEFPLEMDREILVLRHFEHLGNLEVAQLLGIKESTASQRYLRAVDRLRERLE